MRIAVAETLAPANRSSRRASRSRACSSAARLPLADALVFLAGLAQTQRHRGFHCGAVVGSVGPAGLDRAQIADVHDIADAIETLALHHAAQQRLGGRTVAGGVHAPGAKHRPHAADALE